jgi:hypothetical protein
MQKDMSSMLSNPPPLKQTTLRKMGKNAGAYVRHKWHKIKYNIVASHSHIFF